MSKIKRAATPNSAVGAAEEQPPISSPDEETEYEGIVTTSPQKSKQRKKNGQKSTAHHHNFDYYHGSEAEQFQFVQTPRVMFYDRSKFYSPLSFEAKSLYGILHDRMRLSQSNGDNWRDESGRVFIYFTIAELVEIIGCGTKKAVSYLDELEGFGLIERKRQGLGKPNVIYVRNFFAIVDNYGRRQFLNCQYDNSGYAATTILECPIGQSNNTYINNTEFSNTDPFLSVQNCPEAEEYRRCEAYFRKALEIDILMDRYPHHNEIIDGILNLLVDTCCTKRKSIRIAGDDKPSEVVKSRLMKLNAEHIEYVLQSLQDNVSRPRNIKQYLLAALYNAGSTIDPYYQQWVNSDEHRRRSSDKEENNA